MEVDISSIRYNVGASFKVTVSASWPPFEWAGEEICFDQPVTVELELTNTGELYLARGQVTTTVVMACSRCLEPVKLALELPFAVGYTEHKMDTTSPDDNLEVRPISGDIIDVTPDVEETILLSLPMKSLCNPDCQGLCPQCGQNLNLKLCTCKQDRVDPRLAVLRDFINKI
ncbi:MAG: DUF177 domain-containing protein [bacterium]|nr:DUF177 domain-containing protein [Bacillota bacterium]